MISKKGYLYTNIHHSTLTILRVMFAGRQSRQLLILG